MYFYSRSNLELLYGHPKEFQYFPKALETAKEKNRQTTPGEQVEKLLVQ